MANNFWLSVLFWFLSLSVSFAQADSSYLAIRVKLIDANTSEPIPYAHVLIQSNNLGTISDVDGYFELPFMAADSLKISSIGYDELFLATNFLEKDSVLNVIKLEPKAYMLDEVKVTQYPSYERLKKIVTSKVYTEDEKMILQGYQNLEDAGFSFVDLGKPDRTVGGGPISGIYNLFSNDSKSRAKKKELEDDDAKVEKVYKRVAIDEIAKITGLKDTLVIEQFIKFCGFRAHILEHASDYEIYQIIFRKIKLFRKED